MKKEKKSQLSIRRDEFARNPNTFVPDSRKENEFLQRANQFQFGQNQMEMTAFEQELCAKEIFERHKAKVRYVQGIQGVDGGTYPLSGTE